MIVTKPVNLVASEWLDINVPYNLKWIAVLKATGEISARAIGLDVEQLPNLIVVPFDSSHAHGSMKVLSTATEQVLFMFGDSHDEVPRLVSASASISGPLDVEGVYKDGASGETFVAANSKPVYIGMSADLGGGVFEIVPLRTMQDGEARLSVASWNVSENAGGVHGDGTTVVLNLFESDGFTWNYPAVLIEIRPTNIGWGVFPVPNGTAFPGTMSAVLKSADEASLANLGPSTPKVLDAYTGAAIAGAVLPGAGRYYVNFSGMTYLEIDVTNFVATYDFEVHVTKIVGEVPFKFF